MALASRSPDRGDFSIAVMCALKLEAECVCDALDRIWGSNPQDLASSLGGAYTLGAMGAHNVVVVHMSGMGTDRAAAAAVYLHSRFPEIQLTLVVGVCGGMPYGILNDGIVLGDIVISEALVNYDFGRQYSQGFQRKTGIHDILGPPSEKILTLLQKLKVKQNKVCMKQNTTKFLQAIQQKSPELVHPGVESDVLYYASYTHRHRSPTQCHVCKQGDEICMAAVQAECEELECGLTSRMTRSRLATSGSTQPEIHFGIIGSANTVMKSAPHRDALAKEGVIAVEMEGAGVWRHGPTVVIKGVCDYADSHKRKGWQQYAAAAAAACAKAFLLEWSPQKKHDMPGKTELRFHVPAKKVKNLFGRETELAKITACFNEEADRPRILVLHAMGGQGKSQIALEYCHRTRHVYTAVFWVNSSSSSAIIQSLAGVSRQLDASGAEMLHDDNEKVRFAIRTLEQMEHRWLMVFDNCDDFATFSELQDKFLPKVGRGNILFTSRHQGLEELGHSIQVPAMPLQAAIDLLLHRYPDIDYKKCLPQATTIVRRLGNLALAIDQASAYMRYIRLPINKLDTFLPSYLARRERILQHTTGNFWQYTKIKDSIEREVAISAFTTWEMSFQQLLESEPNSDSVAHFLMLSAFFGQIPIDEMLFKVQWDEAHLRGASDAVSKSWMTIFAMPSSDSAARDDAPEDSQKDTARQIDFVHSMSPTREPMESHNVHAIWDSDRYWHLLHRASEISLIQDIAPATEFGGSSFLLHPLIRDWLQLRLPLSSRQAYTHEAASVLANWVIIHDGKDTTAQTKMSILLHMNAVLACDEEFFDVRSRFGREILTCNDARMFAAFYYERGKYSEAVQMCLTVWETRKRVLGAKHIKTLDIMIDLAVTLRKQGKWNEAEQMYGKVLEASSGESIDYQLRKLRAFAGLATVLRNLGKHPKAEVILRGVVEGWEQIGGVANPLTLTSMNNLGLVLEDQGKWTEAEQTFRAVMTEHEKMHGARHPATMTSMSNLADVLKKRGEYDEAEQMYRKVMRMQEEVLGVAHPDTVRTVSNLACLLTDQGKYIEAESLAVRAVKSWLEAFGLQHPQSRIVLTNLCCIWEGLGRDPAEIKSEIQSILNSCHITPPA